MPEPPPPIPILLLKTKSSPRDGYDDYFSAHNYAPSFIPVLEHRFHAENLARVRDLFAAGAFEPSAEHAETAEQTAETDPSLAAGAVSGRRYGGMIFTSQRAVEAFASMLEGGGGGGGAVPNASNTPNSNANAAANMNLNIPLYTVGPATARSLTSLRDKYLPAATIHGVDAGNGENLAHQILEHYNAIYPPPPPSSSQSQSQIQKQKPALLFLVGEQRRDIIPKTLMAPTLAETQRIPVDELVVYGTAEMGSFEQDFETALRRCLTTDEDANGGGEEGGGPVWVVVFSPSGCEGMLRVLGLGPFSSSSSSTSTSSGISGMMMDQGGKRRVFVATIGPTTRDYLREKFGFETDVCAERPSPEGVGEGILRFMRTVGIE